MKIHFEAKVIQVNGLSIVLLPKAESAKLPSRGMVLVEGQVNGKNFQTVLEPDGRGSHWFRSNLKVGETLSLSIEPGTNWPEPTIPSDLKIALAEHPKEYALWKAITPMARWDWIRWVGATSNPETRKHHVEVAIDKLRKGTRRPCCFNRAACTVPEVSKSGMLLE